MTSKGFGTSAGFFASVTITLALGLGAAAGPTVAGPVSAEVSGLSLAWDGTSARGPVLTTASGAGSNVGTDVGEGPNVVAVGADVGEGPNVVV